MWGAFRRNEFSVRLSLWALKLALSGFGRFERLLWGGWGCNFGFRVHGFTAVSGLGFIVKSRVDFGLSGSGFIGV